MPRSSNGRFHGVPGLVSAEGTASGWEDEQSECVRGREGGWGHGANTIPVMTIECLVWTVPVSCSIGEPMIEGKSKFLGVI